MKPNFLYGLVLTGGKSTRMKRDKALLEYHGKPQSVYTYELLRPFCKKVYVSIRHNQGTIPGLEQADYIEDREEFQNMGPTSGILSALESYQDKAWLVVACDLPFLDTKTIEELITNRNKATCATAYTSEHDGLPEPLCAIYEPASRNHFLRFIEQGKNCPRKVLINADVMLLKLTNRRALDNVNHPEEYAEARQALK